MPIRFDETANGSAVEIQTGEEFDLSLLETQTAGYRWTLKNNGEPTCRLLREFYQPATGKTGGSGTHTWLFRAGVSGACSLTLEYRRSWESNADPARTFGMTVRVQP